MQSIANVPVTHTLQPVNADDSLDKNQRHLIDTLIQELDRKTEALQKVGCDCLQLRKENKDKSKEIARLKLKLEEADMQTERLISAFDIDVLPQKELTQRYAMLCKKLETCIRKLKTYEAKDSETQEIIQQVIF
jgi:chromosome segregation ATPase